MKRIVMPFAALLLCTGAGSEPAGNLDWITGRWIEEKGARWTEERWSDARGGVLLGTSKTGHGQVLTDFEFMRIAADGQKRLSFFGAPRGGPPVAFRLVSSGDRSAVFENRLHDYPQRISYRREGNVLIATISDIEGKKAISWRFSRSPD